MPRAAPRGRGGIRAIRERDRRSARCTNHRYRPSRASARRASGCGGSASPSQVPERILFGASALPSVQFACVGQCTLHSATCRRKGWPEARTIAPTGHGAFIRLQQHGRPQIRQVRARIQTPPARLGSRRWPASCGHAAGWKRPCQSRGAPRDSVLPTPRRVSAAVHRADSCPTSAPSRPGSIRSRRRACGLPCAADSRPPAPGCR